MCYIASDVYSCKHKRSRESLCSDSKKTNLLCSNVKEDLAYKDHQCDKCEKEERAMKKEERRQADLAKKHEKIIAKFEKKMAEAWVLIREGEAGNQESYLRGIKMRAEASDEHDDAIEKLQQESKKDGLQGLRGFLKKAKAGIGLQTPDASGSSSQVTTPNESGTTTPNLLANPQEEVHPANRVRADSEVTSSTQSTRFSGRSSHYYGSPNVADVPTPLTSEFDFRWSSTSASKPQKHGSGSIASSAPSPAIQASSFPDVMASPRKPSRGVPTKLGVLREIPTPANDTGSPPLNQHPVFRNRSGVESSKEVPPVPNRSPPAIPTRVSSRNQEGRSSPSSKHSSGNSFERTASGNRRVSGETSKRASFETSKRISSETKRRISFGSRDRTSSSGLVSNGPGLTETRDRSDTQNSFATASTNSTRSSSRSDKKYSLSLYPSIRPSKKPLGNAQSRTVTPNSGSPLENPSAASSTEAFDFNTLRPGTFARHPGTYGGKKIPATDRDFDPTYVPKLKYKTSGPVTVATTEPVPALANSKVRRKPLPVIGFVDDNDSVYALPHTISAKPSEEDLRGPLVNLIDVEDEPRSKHQTELEDDYEDDESTLIAVQPVQTYVELASLNLYVPPSPANSHRTIMDSPTLPQPSRSFTAPTPQLVRSPTTTFQSYSTLGSEPPMRPRRSSSLKLPRPPATSPAAMASVNFSRPTMQKAKTQLEMNMEEVNIGQVARDLAGLEF